MLKFFKQIFIWWGGNTINTRFFTWRAGKKIGTDFLGNTYYEGGLHKDGYPRRWVIYKNYSEASLIPAGWHGWIHHRVNTPPVDEIYRAYDWEKAHQPNLTGSQFAYFPKGSINVKGNRDAVSSDYRSWRPK
ncbi:NADH:ubiquinone oxidoreductase subunit NDUFA12 [Bartonella sp. TP]|uniref:NADH:ubiquinone oxidoreductase subunit NDUFA12 n=1 Tax=Bartonella sp. TP TaxID=3057550 RepID=UPI0025B02460|nr:NADH:ubiquinone oxidoreductase subunit NDUFA12 [Bartonella sp. TP]MDN5248668.1 NADH:ubiquinone oxidoreductase subunit NDUFA12 [Alphaproteobacteria bacterium]WJW79854.1 NADH:ubiquinone oxidoreductase subunit NDUFA12 [Bartonella sp. TP]